MSHIAIFENLLHKRVQCIKPGLERMLAAHEIIGRPSFATPSILVGGTNGKGSTAGLLFAMMMGAGRIGFYCSPQLIHFRERFAVSGADIDDAGLTAVFERLQRLLPPSLYEDLSFFEVITLMAFLLFADAGTGCNILEVGMGGRWDATNISDPLASIMVSVGHDHGEFLGRTLAAITEEKLGIARPGRPLFTGKMDNVLADAGARSIFFNVTHQLRLSWWRLGEHFMRSAHLIEIALPHMRPVSVTLPALFLHAPDYLLDNLTLAAAVYHWLNQQFPLLAPLPLESVLHGLAICAQPAPPTLWGRFMRLSIELAGKPRRVLFDVCHNVEGVQAFRDALAAKLRPGGPRRIPGLVSILSDKEINPMLDILKGILAPLVVFKVNHDRSMKAEDLHPRHGDVPYFASFAAAVRYLADKVQDDAPWVVCGSVLAIGTVLEENDLQLDGLAIDRVVGGEWHFPR